MAENLYASYLGNPNLAQGSSTGGQSYGVYEFKQTADALDKMMSYRFYENRDKWAQANLWAQQQAEQDAAQMKFDLGDMLTGDQKVILDKIGQYNAMYAQDPTVTNLQTDRNGKVTNGEQYAKFQNAGNEIRSLIKRGNYRKSQYNTLVNQVSKMTDPTKHDRGVEFAKKAANTAITDDIFLYPDLDVFDLTTIKPEDAKFDRTIELPNYLKDVNFTMSDVVGSTSKYMVKYNTAGQELYRDTLNGTTQTYNETLVKTIKGMQEGFTNDDLLSALDKSPEGKVVADMWRATNNYAQAYNEQTPYMLNKEKMTVPDLKDGITPYEMTQMILSMNAKLSSDAKTQYTGETAKREQFDLTLAENKRRADLEHKDRQARLNLDRDKLNQEGRQFAQLHPDQQQVLANEKLNTFANFVLAGNDPNAKVNTDGSISIDLNQTVKNAFGPTKKDYFKQGTEVKLPGKGGAEKTIKMTDDVPEYEVVGAHVKPSANPQLRGNPDANQTTIYIRRNKLGTEGIEQGKIEELGTFSNREIWDKLNNADGPQNSKAYKDASNVLLNKYRKPYPDAQMLRDFYNNQDWKSPWGSEGEQKTDLTITQGNGKAPIKLADPDKIDPSKMVKNQIYEGSNGQYGMWNGKGFIPVKIK